LTFGYVLDDEPWWDRAAENTQLYQIISILGPSKAAVATAAREYGRKSGWYTIWNVARGALASGRTRSPTEA
jgi:hypothetical protein